MSAGADIRTLPLGSSVLFLETRGGGLSSNLLEMRDSLLRTRPDLELRYLITSRPKGRLLRLSRSFAVWRACRRVDAVICASDSLPPRISAYPRGQKRVLIHPVRERMLDSAPPSKPAADLSRYTDIAAESEFAAAAIRRELGEASPVRVHATGLPITDRFVSEGALDRARHSLLTLAPGSAGKKVVTFSTMRKASAVLKDVDLAALAERLGDKYFLIIKAADSDDVLCDYPGTLSRSILDAQTALRNNDYLLVTDVLVTTVFADAVRFATSRRELRLLCSPDDARGLGRLLPARFAGLMVSTLSSLPESLAEKDAAALSHYFADAYAASAPGRACATLLSEVLGA